MENKEKFVTGKIVPSGQKSELEKERISANDFLRSYEEVFRKQKRW